MAYKKQCNLFFAQDDDVDNLFTQIFGNTVIHPFNSAKSTKFWKLVWEKAILLKDSRVHPGFAYTFFCVYEKRNVVINLKNRIGHDPHLTREPAKFRLTMNFSHIFLKILEKSGFYGDLENVDFVVCTFENFCVFMRNLHFFGTYH